MKESNRALQVVPISHTKTAQLSVPDHALAVEDSAEPPAAEPSAFSPAAGEKRPTIAENRGASRYPFTASAEAFEPRTRTRIAGRLADLGVGGCYIDTVSPFPVGTTLRIRLTSEGRTLQAAAVVTYSVHGMGMGLAFSRMSPEHANILSVWLAELSGDAPSEGDWETAPDSPEPAGAEAQDSPRLRDAARDLVELLRKKRVLTEAECAALLKKMSG